MKNYTIEVDGVKCCLFTDKHGLINVIAMLEDLGFTNIKYYETFKTQ